MKKTLFSILLLSFGLFACAQKPPQAVTDNFAKKFANASKVDWDQEEENEWEAEFKLDGLEMTASFDLAGNWLSTEAELTEIDVPEKVMNAVKEAYNGWDIELVESIETPDFKGFEFELEKDEAELEILVSANGKITVKKESNEEGENEDED